MATRRLLTFSFLVLLCTFAACEDRRADKAYVRGDYDKALGLMYDKGQGVPQSDAEALQWYERAAEQGEPRAQYNLGLMHLNGQGVPPDLVTAYYWVSLSASHGNQHAMEARDYISEKMSVEQIAEGKRRVREYEEQVAQRKSCVVCNLFSGKPAP